VGNKNTETQRHGENIPETANYKLIQQLDIPIWNIKEKEKTPHCL